VSSSTLLWHILLWPSTSQTTYISVSQTVVLGFCPCGPLRLNISPKKKEKIKLTWIALSHTVVENLKQFAFKWDKSRLVRRTFWLIKVVPTWKKFGKRWPTSLWSVVLDAMALQCPWHNTWHTELVHYRS
jgi:hypothetical protein